MARLLKELKIFYKKHRRDLPWRRTRDPYKILVSEVMLQQTQVDRVVPFYTTFVKRFPTARTLAQARLSEVLKLWQGLGYNRRAKCLWDSAKILSGANTPGGGSGDRVCLSRSREVFVGQLEKLPGVGHYTARAVSVFAYNRPEVLIETNIRTVFLHHCFVMIYHNKVSDTEILPLIAVALKRSGMPPREFYYGIMDYGAHLKKSGVRLNSRSTHYIKQSKFEGSKRQKRAARLRRLLARNASERELAKALHS